MNFYQTCTILLVITDESVKSIQETERLIKERDNYEVVVKMIQKQINSELAKIDKDNDDED